MKRLFKTRWAYIIAVAVLFIAVLTVTMSLFDARLSKIESRLEDQQKQIKNSENAAKTKEVGLNICLQDAQKEYDTYLATHQLAPTSIDKDGHKSSSYSMEDWQAASARLEADKTRCNEQYK